MGEISLARAHMGVMRFKSVIVDNFLVRKNWAVSFAGLIILALVINTILPAAQVQAERTLNWTSNADFLQNKTSLCGATNFDSVNVTGTAYTDNTCQSPGLDASMKLEGTKPEFLLGAISVVAGDGYTAALKENGTVWTWGYNGLGQLGDGTTINRRLPVQVKDAAGTGFLAGVKQIAVGTTHTVALKEDGTVWAWGTNNNGQLGDNTTSIRSLPVQVKDTAGTGFLAGVKQVSVWTTHTVALKEDGTVWAWGNNGNGQLGDNTTTSRLLPIQTKDTAGTGNLTSVKQVAAGSTHTVALKEDGTVWAWGNNGNGQLGDNTVTARLLPTQTKDPTGTGTLTEVAQIAVGSTHAIVVKNDETVWAWGSNSNGQLGNNTISGGRLPVQVKDAAGTGVLTNVKQVAAGGNHTVALKEDGTVWAWGYNSNGQLGDNTTTSRSLAVQVKDSAGSGVLSDVKKITAGTTHTTALIDDGTLRAWGENNKSQLGDGTVTNRLRPIQVQQITATGFISGVSEVYTSGKTNYSLSGEGVVSAWGDNQYGQLGDGSDSSAPFPVTPESVNLAGIKSITSGTSHAVALKEDGTVWAWGYNNAGQLGDDTTTRRLLPVQVKDSAGTGVLTNIKQVAVGGSHTVALKNDGTVWAWGSNSSGQLGDNTLIGKRTPVQVKDAAGNGVLNGVKQIAAGVNHTVALKDDGTVWAWGYNNRGQLGDNTLVDRSLPVQVKDAAGNGVLSGVKQVISGDSSITVALKDDGTVWAWGYNAWGQLGDNTTTNRSLPVQVKDSTGTGILTGVKQVAVGSNHNVVLKNDGTVWAWGYNSTGQLGDNTIISPKRLPIQVKDAAGTGFLTDVKQVAAGNTHTVALKNDGTVWAWGGNDIGQLGDNTLTTRLLPVKTVGAGGYKKNGSVSGFVVDMGQTKRTQWRNLQWQTEALQDETGISFAIRTSKNGETWSSWSNEYTQTVQGSTSHTADLASVEMSRFAEVRLTLETKNTAVTPQVNSFSLSYMYDSVPPIKNAKQISAAKTENGTIIAPDSWTNVAPYFAWEAGEDGQNESGIWGYCLYVGHDQTANVEQTKGLLGTSPIDANGTCQYLTDATSLNLANTSTLMSNLESDTRPYFLRIKAVDNVGNVYDSDAEQFSFKFDNVAPKNPDYISAPAGFVSNKSVLLTWPTSGLEAPSDATSGLKGLQYRIGANGKWYGDGHTGTQDNSDLLANDGSYRLDETFDYPELKEGSNVIYFRSYDTAGNTSTTYSTAAVKINTSAPNSPENLTATPSASNRNSFAFSWQKPTSYVGDGASLSYCYTVNTLPNAGNCTYISSTSLPADAYATQPGENNLYVVARDESGNINYSTYASVLFSADTPAPGIVRSIEIADISTKATSVWKTALSWEQPAEAGSGIAKYQILRSIDDITYVQVATTSGKSYVDSDLSQVKYFYKIKACDSANNCGAGSAPVSILPTGRYTSPPEIISSPSVQTSTRKAEFYWVTDRESDSRVQYGVKSGVYLPGEVTVATSKKIHSVDIANLDAGTTYFYRVKWTDEDGNTGISKEYSFKTLPAPILKKVEVTKTSLTAASIRAVSRDAARITLQYGKSESFGGVKSVNTSLAESTYDIELSGLDDGSTYYYKITTTDADGNEYDSNRIDTFKTPVRPVISNLRFQPADGEATSTQKITWTTNTPTSSLVSYGSPEATTIDAYDSKLVVAHEVIIADLKDDSVYSLVAQSRDADGNLASSDRQIFRTALDTRPPKVSNVRIETSISGTGSEASGRAIVYWKTDEPAKSQVAYAAGSNVSTFTNYTAEDTRLTTDHIVIVSNLSASTIYSLQPISKDSADNITRSQTQSAIISRPTDSVLDIVVGALSKLFAL